MKKRCLFQRKKTHYFEGWYIKNTAPEHTFTLIPGYSITEEKKEAFLQIILDDTSYFISYPSSMLKRKKDEFFVKLAGNLFTKRGFRLCIHTDELQIDGIVRFGKLNTLDYSIMGPLQAIPFLQCKHKVISMDHALYGSVTINGKTLEFGNGRGYIEGDEGSSFPELYTWSQCNQFKRPFTSVMVAVATIPVLERMFDGSIAAIIYKGKEYRFATYLGAKVQTFTRKKIVLTQNDMVLTATLKKSNPVHLDAPLNDAMIRSIEEHARCTVHYEFSVAGHLLINEECSSASFESSFYTKVVCN